jgi:probable HAF family extracellular repeat protein
MINRTALALGAGVLAGLAACGDSARLTEPSLTSQQATGAVEHQFTVRNLGTLGGNESFALGINERAEVVGSSLLASGKVRAFLWRAGQGMRNLGSLDGDESRARGINDRSEVVGFSRIANGSARAFLWIQGQGMRSLGTLGGENSEGNSINNRQEVVGFAENPNGRPRAFLWRPGRGMKSLGTLGGAESRARDINDATQVVGFSQTADGHDHAFLWTAERGMEDLGTLGGPTSSAHSISETGVVVGSSSTVAGRNVAFIWTRAGGMRRLSSPDSTESANAVNTHRRVVGQNEGLFSPFVWIPGSGVEFLPTLGGDRGLPNDINEFGQIAGASETAGAGARAVLWTPTAGPLAVRPTGAATSSDFNAP